MHSDMKIMKYSRKWVKGVNIHFLEKEPMTAIKITSNQSNENKEKVFSLFFHKMKNFKNGYSHSAERMVI